MMRDLTKNRIQDMKEMRKLLETTELGKLLEREVLVPNHKFDPSNPTDNKWNVMIHRLTGNEIIKSLEHYIAAFDLLLTRETRKGAIKELNRMKDNFEKKLVLAVEAKIQHREELRAKAQQKSWQDAAAGYMTKYPVIVMYHEETKKKLRIRYDLAVGLQGLLAQMVKHWQGNAVKKTEAGEELDKFEATAMGVKVPVLHLKDQTEGDQDLAGLMSAFRKQGWVPVKGKHLLDKSLYAMLTKLFPRAVDMRAYISSFMSPLKAGGLWIDASVKLTTITSYNKDGQTIPAGCDGSGRIHSKHPLLQYLKGWNSKDCPATQFRGVNFSTGLFAKGVFVVDDRCLDDDGNPDIWVDWAQIKGLQKAEAKECIGKNIHRRDVMTIGIIDVFRRHNPKMNFSFQSLQIMENVPSTRALAERWVDESLDAFVTNGGPLGMLENIAANDPQIDLILRLKDQLKEKLGLDVTTPEGIAAIPFVHNRLEDNLGRMRYHNAQGAGVKELTKVLVIDNGLESGTCAIRSTGGKYPIGSLVALVRPPIVTPHNQVVLKIVEPLTHMRVRGQVPLCVIFMTLLDTLIMFADDDGDIASVCDDKELIENLQKNKIDFGFGQDALYRIEPETWEGDPKAKISSSSLVGMVMLEGDGRGPVGLVCVLKAAAIAEEVDMLPLAMAVIEQCAIDAAKHSTMYPDPRMLVQRRNWEKDSEGWWKPKSGTGLSREDMGTYRGYQGNSQVESWMDGEHISTNLLQQFVRDLCGGRMLKDQLSWRVKSKRLTSETDSEYPVKAKYENLVHHTARYATEEWNKMYEGTEAGIEFSAQDLIPKLLSMQVTPLDKQTYKRTLHRSSGMQAYGVELKKILALGYEREERRLKIDAVYTALLNSLRKLSVGELVQIWVTEWNLALNTKHENRVKGHINRAYRAVLWEGSPVLKALGLESSSRCEFMGTERMLKTKEWINNRVLALRQDGVPATAFDVARDSILKSKKHEEETGVRLADCPTCSNLIRDMIVGDHRDVVTKEVRAVAGELVTGTNAELGWERARKVLEAKKSETK
jgi:hypothetical protein